MEGDQEFMNDDLDLTYGTQLSGGERDDTLSILFPELPRDYFKNKKNPLVPIRWRPKMCVKPYFRKRDLNMQGVEESTDRPKYTYEIGIKGTF